jgi:hypothetical protein
MNIIRHRFQIIAEQELKIGFRGGRSKKITVRGIIGGVAEG